MQILLIGGAGGVGRSLVPYLANAHHLTILDRQAAPVPLARSIVGDATDPAVLREAMRGIDAVVHLAAVVPRGIEAQDGTRIRQAFDVNVAGVYLALCATENNGIRHFVHVSTMSVYRDYGRVPIDASSEPDSTQPYGQSKRLAEQLCAAAATESAMTVTSLRLAQPTSDELWPLWRSPGAPDARPEAPTLADGTTFNSLAPIDLARAVQAAITRHGPYIAVPITGDIHGVGHFNDPAPQLLGWRPERQ